MENNRGGGSEKCHGDLSDFYEPFHALFAHCIHQIELAVLFQLDPHEKKLCQANKSNLLVNKRYSTV